ncbi:PI-PLC domain-containing protein [Oceanobacillus damuensis]|uniref:hypothetical protein n=1 Tax=Oceanobacillus damuensis TaxID=937928 RepID=UPI00082ED304|nr:hypothetical protein [Oceanobacillus damuensis]
MSPQKSRSEIKEFETIEVFNNQTVTEEIPTLEEIIHVFGDTEHYYIESRLVDGERLMEEPLIEMLNKHDLETGKIGCISNYWN